MDSTEPFDLEGVWVPIVTPFAASGAVDGATLAHLGERLLNDGAKGLVALGTTGEPATLSAEERSHVVEICSATCRAAGRALIVGAGTNSTQGTIDEITMLNAAADIDAALVVVPYYTRPSERAIVEHFGLVADASPIPIIMYNVPYRTGRELNAASIIELATHDNIVGLKQSVGCIDRDTLEVLRHRLDDFAVLAGDDAFIVPTVLMGAKGAIAAAAHLCTPLFVEMVEAALACNVHRASRLAELLLPVVDSGFAEPNPSAWKGALHHTGELPTDHLRRPMTTADANVVEDLITHAAAANASART